MKYKKTNYDGIMKYTLKSGKTKYRARVTYTDKYNKRREESKQGFNTITEARAYKAQLEAQVLGGRMDKFANKEITLERYWEEYSKTKVRIGDWNKGTEETNFGRMDVWLKKFGAVILNQITKNDIQNYIFDLYDEHNYSQETMKGLFRIFNQVINDAVDEDYLEKNKFKKISIKHPNRKWKPKEKQISQLIFNEFIEKASKEMAKDVYACFYLLTFGLRRGEAYGLKQNVITFLDNGLTQLKINWSRTRDYPEGTYVKSRDSNRIVVVDEKATKLLKEQIERARAIKALHNETLHMDDYIFISTNGKPFYISKLNEEINKVAKRIDPDLKLSPHMFRHTFATQANAAGVDSLQLMRYLGHADISMTGHYTGSTVGNAENVLRKIRSLKE